MDSSFDISKIIKGFQLADSENSRQGVLDYREKGALRGKFLGFPYFNEHYTMALPGCTDWTGFPASGKSEFLLELLMNTSEFYGWKHLLFVPDVGDKVEVLAILVHKSTGKTFDKRYINSNYIGESEVHNALDWIYQHFFIVTKVDLKAKITPYQFWDLAAQMNKEVIGGIQTATIDSWKDMRHGVGMDGESFGRDDKYLEDVLSYRNAMAELHKMHFNIVIHPVKTEADKDGQRKAPGPYDLKGGSEWFNSGKCMITAHRVSGSYNAVDIIVTKAKPKSVAKVGSVRFYFDTAIAKYYWDNDGDRIFASKINTPPKALLLGNSEQSKVELYEGEDDDDMPF